MVGLSMHIPFQKYMLHKTLTWPWFLPGLQKDRKRSQVPIVGDDVGPGSHRPAQFERQVAGSLL